MIAQRRPPQMLDRTIGQDFGTFSTYAGPVTGTVAKGLKVRALGFGYMKGNQATYFNATEAIS